MGAEREDSDPKPLRLGTEPGLGKSSGANQANAVAVEDDPAAPVDFDALHAALGDPVAYEELPSGPAIERGSESDVDVEVDAPGQVGTNGVSESSGQSSATYASARPRTIPPTRAPVEDLNAPAVIVAADTDTVPTAPPKMTVPLRGPPPAPPFPGARPPSSNPQLQAAQHPSGPHGVAHGHPSSGPHVASNPFTPQPFPAPGRPAHMTMRMPDRPAMMRRAKTPTIVMRVRGPSAKQKLLAFMAMLVLVTACGIAVIVWRKPRLLGLDPPASPTSSASSASGASGAWAVDPARAPSLAPTTTASATASASSPAAASAASAATPAASAKKVPKPPAPAPPALPR